MNEALNDTLLARSDVAEYNATAAGLAALRSRLSGVVHDCTTAKGMDAARKDRRECVTLRTTLEEIRVREKAPILERGRLLDAEAKRITAEIEALELPIDAQIKRVEQEKANAKAAAEKAEADRVGLIRQRIEWVRGYPVEFVGKSVLEIDEGISTLSGLDAGIFAEFTTAGADSVAMSIARLRDMRTVRLASDAEALALKVERERLDAEKRERDARIAAEDADRKYSNDWDDAHREALQRVEDTRRAIAERFDRDWDEAHRLQQEQRDSIAANARKQERAELETKSEPWRALRSVIDVIDNGRPMCNNEQDRDALLVIARDTAQAAIDAREQLHELIGSDA